jgi:hypothetical protein
MSTLDDAIKAEHEAVAERGKLNSIEALQAALARLSNEVLGSLPLMEPLARRELGNTNYSILMQRATEARTLLSETGNLELTAVMVLFVHFDSHLGLQDETTVALIYAARSELQALGLYAKP